MNQNHRISALAYAALFLFFALLYIVTMPANHIESVDRHAYAMWAETVPLGHLIDTRSILFTVLNRLLFLGSQSIGVNMPATTLITTYSVLAGAGAVALMARLLNQHFHLGPIAALAGGALLGLCYGVWRFAMEVEVYVASIFLVLAALLFLLDRLAETPLKAARFILPGIASGLVVMFYQPNVFPLFLAIPVLFLPRERWLPFVLYGAAGTLTVIACYVAAFLLTSAEAFSLPALLAFVGSRNAEFEADPLSLTTFVKMALAISHTMLSSNWIFGVQPLAEAFQNRFPATETEFKVLSAAHFQPWVYAPILLAPILGVTAFMLLRAARISRHPINRRLIAYLLVWLLVYGLVAGRLGPGIPEVWITVVPIWVVLISVFLFQPAIRNNGRNLVFALVACFGIWNWAGGVGMLKNAEGDFLLRQVAWLQVNATENDLIVMTDSTWKTRTYLQHVLLADVLAILPGCTKGAEPEIAILNAARAATAAQNGRVFAFQTFVEPSPRLAHVENCPARRDNALLLAQEVGSSTRQIVNDGAFSLFQILP